jgi:TatD DNase family protein
MNGMYVDVHAHVDLVESSVIERAFDAGVHHIIAPGIDKASNEKVIELAQRYQHVHAANGFYPDQTEVDLNQLQQHSSSLIAISECGLDYHITQDKDAQLLQKTIFKQQITFANTHKLPLIVHSRKAEQDVLDILEHASVPVVLHCFEGNKKLLQRAIESKYYLTVTSNIKRADQVQLRAKLTPLKQLLTETDTPYQGPERDKPSEPAYVIGAIHALARIKGLDSIECANMIYMNYKKLFSR